MFMRISKRRHNKKMYIYTDITRQTRWEKREKQRRKEKNKIMRTNMILRRGKTEREMQDKEMCLFTFE